VQCIAIHGGIGKRRQIDCGRLRRREDSVHSRIDRYGPGPCDRQSCGSYFLECFREIKRLDNIPRWRMRELQQVLQRQ
jgi:hypothetical protein